MRPLQWRARDVPTVASVLLALLVWTRPDGALFCALAAAALIAVHGLSIATLRAIVRLAALPALAWFAQLAFRLAYYGDWLPNTAYVKVSGSTHHAVLGAHYIAGGLLHHAPFVVAAIAGVRLARPIRRRAIVVPLIIAIGWTAYVTFIGGDIFPGRRHFLPILVCLAFLVAATWRSSAGRLPIAAQVALLALIGAGHIALQRHDPFNVAAQRERWEWDCGALMATLRTAVADRHPLIAADAVGCTGYFGKLPTLDLMGLNDRHIARQRPADFGQGNVGHELGDGRYVLSRAPDIVFLCLPEGPPTGCFRSGAELVALPDFIRRYVLIPIRVNALLYQPQLWFDTASPRLGVTQTDRDVHIPGFLFARTPGSVARVARDNRLVAHLFGDTTVTFDKLTLPPGRWQARATATQPVDVTLGTVPADAPTTATGGATTVVRVKAGAQGADLIEVVITR